MKTEFINRRSQEMQRILKAAKKEDVVLRTAEGDEVLLSLIDDFDYEVAAQRRNKKLMDFLKESYRRARKGKGISLEESRRRLGLPPRSGPVPPPRTELKTISVPKRVRALNSVLTMARYEDIVFETTDGRAYALTAIRDGDQKDANRRLSETVMAYLDELGEQGKLPKLEVVFVRDRPLTKARNGEKPARRRKGA